MAKNYPEIFEHLQKNMGKFSEDLAGPMRGFGVLHRNAVADGALSTKTKELIALSIAISVRCDGCISFHVHGALEAGATREEILETIGVAIMMGGGPAVMYGVDAMEAVDQFLAADAL
ncbi:MAG: carboxymuconolactone decarboxylase family protein [Chloroflexota bacterium]|nr:carboxymuconolactone decarboxylase family protein [Chloroflexota bacterium]